jgi:hypothetical protein
VSYSSWKSDRPACWDWPVSESVYYLAAKARYCKNIEAVFSVWQPGCAICEALDAVDLDHDHSTNFVRGLLCHSCNIAEGKKNSALLANYRHINPAFILGVEIQYSPGWISGGLPSRL